MRMLTCRHKLVIFAVRVVEKLGEPPEQLAHVFLLKHLVHRRLHTSNTNLYVLVTSQETSVHHGLHVITAAVYL